MVQADDGRPRQHIANALTANDPNAAQMLSTDWVENSVSHFVYHFVLEHENGLPGLHYSLPDLRTRFSETKYLQDAIRAVALAHLVRVNKMSQTYTRKSWAFYGNAVSGLRIALDDPSERTSAPALMTTELLSEFDVSAYAI